MTPDQVVDFLLTPDSFTPDQFRDSLSTVLTRLSPEQRLLFAILRDSMCEYRLRSNGINHQARVTNWVNGAPATISFEDCCEALDLNPSWFRPRFREALTHPIVLQHRSPADFTITRQRHRKWHQRIDWTK